MDNEFESDLTVDISTFYPNDQDQHLIMNIW